MTWGYKALGQGFHLKSLLLILPHLCFISLQACCEAPNEERCKGILNKWPFVVLPNNNDSSWIDAHLPTELYANVFSLR